MIDLIGMKFGKLLVDKYAGKNKWKRTLWLCQCDCGKKTIVAGCSLKSGNTKSCGCFKIETTKKRNTTHGHTKNTKASRTYNVWKGLVQRCGDPNHNSYRYYGKRKINICYRWSNKNPKGFINFLKDMGEKPQGKSIDRIDNKKGYNKENCKWSTIKEQNRNKRNNHLITYNNKTQCLSAWAEEYNISCPTLWARICVYKWTIEKALITPTRKRRTTNG